MKLPFNKVGDFFDLFLCDEAPHSLSNFHQSVMRDTKVSLSYWTRDDATETAGNSDESLSRTIQFEHKSKVSVAQVTRNQTYRRYGECACIKNVTRIKGVPSGMFFQSICDAKVTKLISSHFIIVTLSRNFLYRRHVDSRKMRRRLHHFQRKISRNLFEEHLFEIND